MKSFSLLILLSLGFSACSFSPNKARLPSSEKEIAEMKEFHNFDSDAESIFSALSNKKWSQKFDTIGVILRYDIDSNGNDIPIEDNRFPFGFEKKLEFSLSKKTKKTLLGKRDHYFFGMLGGTWAGVDTQYPSHGGGYASQIPVKKLGVNKDGQTYRFLFWGREDYYVDEEARRMHTDILHTALSEAKDTVQLEKILKDEPACQDILKRPFSSYIECAITPVVFDYLILEYSLVSPDFLLVIGKNIDSNDEVFRIKMKSK